MSASLVGSEMCIRDRSAHSGSLRAYVLASRKRGSTPSAHLRSLRAYPSVIVPARVFAILRSRKQAQRIARAHTQAHTR
eukprot:14105795-Alexandrium_andersonii.AAC.1